MKCGYHFIKKRKRLNWSWRYNDPSERDQFSKTKRHVKLNWDDIRAIQERDHLVELSAWWFLFGDLVFDQDLYDGPKSSKARHDHKREQLRGDYTAAITLSATRILVRHVPMLLILSIWCSLELLLEKTSESNSRRQTSNLFLRNPSFKTAFHMIF